ncbi:MAG: hypothetical protein L0Y56_13800 [Nitrospira sp.]|nr:hypothetical protein [Nitrospira sp.]
MLSMDLVKHIKHGRAQKKVKQPFRRTLFDRVSAIVKRHALGEAFVKTLENFSEDRLREYLRINRIRPKDHLEPPLFSLATQAEYRATIAILDMVNNPYLHFVSSPDEILLCRPLFHLNPFLEPEKLAHHHFATLLLRELDGDDGGDVKAEFPVRTV